MLLAAGEYGFDWKAEAGWNGVLAWALHVVCARTAREGHALSESGSIADLSEHTVMPYAERGWICVSGSHVCVYARCSARRRRPCRCTWCMWWSPGGHGLPKSRFLLHKLFFRFIGYLAVGRCNASALLYVFMNSTQVLEYVSV